MKKSFGLILASLLATSISFAQNEVDALRYSQIQFGGTSRFTAMGGAFGALGGDFSTLSVNPAGIGIYRKSELSFSSALYNSTTSSSYLGSSATDDKWNFNIGNLGYVGVWSTGNSTGWLSGSFGIGYNRTNNFHSRTEIDGFNESGSLLDSYSGYLNENNISPSVFNDSPGGELLFGTDLAWNTFLIDTLPGGNSYDNPIGLNGERQRNTIRTNGSMGETVISVGGNYNNRLYVGATMGISSINYTSSNLYQEFISDDDTTTNLDFFSFDQDLNTQGTGINAKLGFIYRLNDFARLGGAFHTPTYYSLSDEWSSSMNSSFNDGVDQYSALSPIGNFNYFLRTPLRANGSVAFLFGKLGLLSLDYDYIDYSTAKLRAEDGSYDFKAENDRIKDTYTATHNIRLGTEWRVDQFNSLRAGVAFYDNPYDDSIDNDGSITTYSIGFGHRNQDFFIDVAYLLSQRSSRFYMYDPAIAEPATLDQLNHSLSATVGLKF